MSKQELERRVYTYDHLNSEVVNAILSFYGNIKTIIPKKEFEFSFESLLLGASFEVSYHDGILNDAHFVRLGGMIELMYKEKLIEAIQNSYIKGIPYKINVQDDIKVRGIITLNKEELESYFKNDLSELLKKNNFIDLGLNGLEPSLRNSIVFYKIGMSYSQNKKMILVLIVNIVV